MQSVCLFIWHKWTVQNGWTTQLMSCFGVWWPHGCRNQGRLSPPGEYDWSICAAAAVRPFTVITLATCFHAKAAKLNRSDQLSLASLQGLWIDYQLCWVKGENVTTAGWLVTLCDLVWHVSFCSSEASYKLLYSVYLLIYSVCTLCLQCFDTVGWARASGLRKLSDKV